MRGTKLLEGLQLTQTIIKYKFHILTVLFFSSIYGCLLLCCSPDVTWACGDLDLFDFLFAANTASVPHAPGLPLYTLLGWLVLRLPGNDAWLMSIFLSLLPSILTSILIFRLVYLKTDRWYLPFISSLVYSSSHIVFSQSIIPEIYTLVTFFIVLSYYFLETGHPKLAVVSTSLGLTVTYMPLLFFLVAMIMYKEYRKYWYLIFVGLPFYLFLPIAIREPYISTFRWFDIEAIYRFLAHHGDLTLSIPIWEIPQRVYEYLQVFAVGFGVALIPAIAGLLTSKKLFWLAVPYIIYCTTTLGPISYWHLIPAVAFMAIGLGHGIPIVSNKLRFNLANFSLFITVITLGILAMNTWYYDIGRTLDNNTTGARQFMNQLNWVEDGAVIVSWDACTYAGVFYYNSKSGRDLNAILPIFEYGADAFRWEREKVTDLGFVLPELPPDDKDYVWDEDPVVKYIKSFKSDEDDHLRCYTDTALANTIMFSYYNKDTTFYAAVPDLINRDRRKIWLVRIRDGVILGTYMKGTKYEGIPEVKYAT